MIAVCVHVANADVLPVLVKCERIFQQLCLASDITLYVEQRAVCLYA
jgi:hypothetical protein